ncbi:hypothetical protein Vafri_18720 [Volvox africanus]|uniref:Uncharacterized protein n=1 Tax=Volvox africanus TaxID=51714 RepID=A0A8J4F7W5_9CHLO|nr:hypothetical protein Vafri_18720 [Volvox africanus]
MSWRVAGRTSCYVAYLVCDIALTSSELQHELKILLHWFLASAQALSISGQMQNPFLLALSISEVAAEQDSKIPRSICFYGTKDDGDVCYNHRREEQRPGAFLPEAICCCGFCILAFALLYYCYRCCMRVCTLSFGAIGTSSQQQPLTKLTYQALSTMMMTHGTPHTWRLGRGTELPPYQPFYMRPRYGCECRPLHMTNVHLPPGFRLVPTVSCRESTVIPVSYLPRAQLVSMRIQIQGEDPL